MAACGIIAIVLYSNDDPFLDTPFMLNKQQNLPANDFNGTDKKEKIKQGLASLSLEGMHPTKAILPDLALLLDDKISEDEFLERCLKRVTKQDDAE